jgi:hypothetical protein
VGPNVEKHHYGSLEPPSPVRLLGNAEKRRFVCVGEMKIRLLTAALFVAGMAFAQTAGAGESKSKTHNKRNKHDIRSGAGDIAKGTGKGALNAAKGTGKAAGDLATLHPINAAADLGKGAAGAGKNVGVGTVKGTGKIVKGTGKAIKRLF